MATMPSLIVLEGVGPVRIAHSLKATRLRITVRPGGVQVSVPRGVPLDQGKAFAQTHVTWIARHVGRMRRLAAAQAVIADALPQVSEEAARGMLTARLAELAAQHGLSYARVSIRCQKTRWGSCSRRGTISLNIRLARLPGELVDYVILHELLHTRIKGHGGDFWRALDELVGDARGLQRRLRGYPLTML